MKLTASSKKNIKTIVVCIAATLLKAYYLKKVDRLIELAIDKINRDYTNEIKLDDLDKLFEEEEVTEI